MEELKDKIDFIFEMTKMTFLRTVSFGEIINSGTNKMLDLYLSNSPIDIDFDGNGINYLMLIISKDDIDKVKIALKYKPSKITILLTIQKLNTNNITIIDEIVKYYQNNFKDIDAFNNSIKKSPIHDKYQVSGCY
jgi:hypothetical protein